MPFNVVQVQGGQIALADSDGNLVGVVLDGSVYRVQMVAKVARASDGAYVNPATQETLIAIKDTDGIKKIVDALPTGTNTLGKIDQGAAGATAWKTDGSGVTQPISATALPLPTGAATETTLAAIKNTDGIKKIVDALPTGTNTLGKIDQGAAGATAWKTDGSGVTQPISATSLPLPTGAATETTLGLAKTDLDNIYTRQADGNQKAIARGGAKGTTTAADLTSTAEGADHQALDVQIMHGGNAKDPTQVRALTSSDVVTAAQGTAAATAGGWPTKVTDGTNVLGVDAQNHAYVAGKAAPGFAPASNPVSVSGVDGGGLKRTLLTDTAGRIQTSIVGSSQVEGRAADGATPVGNPVLIAGQDGTNVQSIKTDDQGRIETVPAARPYQLPLMIDLFYRATDGAIVASQFKRVLTYTIPTSYSAYLIQFSSWQNETAYSRLIIETSMGTLNVATNAFTDGSAYTTPQFAGTVEAEVTTLFGGANNITVTVTYVNQSGVAGRTGTFSIPKSSVVGTRVVMSLQAGDFGVRDITAMSAAPSGGAGAIKVLGFLTLTWHSNLATTTGIITQYQQGAISMPEGTVLGVEYSGGSVAKERVFDVNIQLVQ